MSSLPETRPPAAPAFDEALLRAWQSGNVDAREAAWTMLWDAVSSTAIRFCRRFCRDAATAEDWAASAIADASVDIERRLAADDMPWPGPGPFLGWVSAFVIFRCRDQRRDSRRWFDRVVELGTDETDEFDGSLASLVSCPATQEEDLIRDERDRDGLLRLVRDLAILRDLCQDSPSLLNVLDQMETYLRQCLIDALPDAIDAELLSLEELAETARPERVEATKVALYRWIGQELDIDRNTLYQRMKRIHALRNRTSRPGKEKRWLQ
jgi:DNA-directed RNA polymerase specialized sigma24 family protein